MKTIIFILLLTITSTVNCQTNEPSNDKKLFIAPFIEFNYNDNIKIGDRFSNTFWNTESYSMKLLDKKENNIYVSNFTIPIKYTTYSFDSIIKHNIKNWNTKNSNDTLKVIKKPIYINENGFIGSLTYTYSNIYNKYSVVFSGSKIYSDGYTTFEYMQLSDNKLNTKKESLIVKSLLKRVVYIDSLTLAQSKDEIIKDITIKLKKTTEKSLAVIDKNKETTNYLVEVSKSNTLKYSVEVPLKGTYYATQTIEPNKENKLIISFDKKYGNKTYTCNLIVTTSTNRKIKIPFKVDLSK